jgi:hypothetical protein
MLILQFLRRTSLIHSQMSTAIGDEIRSSTALTEKMNDSVDGADGRSGLASSLRSYFYSCMFGWAFRGEHRERERCVEDLKMGWKRSRDQYEYGRACIKEAFGKCRVESSSCVLTSMK